MSLRTDKKNVFTTIGAYSSLAREAELTETTDTFSSLNENRNPLTFLIETLKIVIGTEALKILVGKMFSEVIDNIEPTLKNTLESQLTDFNSGETIPDYFKNTGDGINIPLEEIDFFSKLKTDPNSDVGQLLYGESEENLDSKIYNAIVADGTDVEFGNIVLNYSSINDTLNVKSTTNDDTLGSWISNFIQEKPIINKDAFLAGVLNLIFGSISSKEDKSIEKIIEEKKIEKLLHKITEQSLKDGHERDDDIVITNSELNDLYDQAFDLKNGIVRYNMGCSVVFREVEFSDVSGLIEKIINTSNPLEISNEIEKNLINNAEIDDGVNEENKISIIDAFFQKIIQFIVSELTKLLTLTPQALILLSIVGTIKNNGIYVEINPIEYINKNKTFIRCVLRGIMNEINKFIYNLILGFLLTLIKPIVKKIIKEKINQYIGLLKSLISI